MSDYSVENEEGFARVYDDDKKIKVRRGDIQAVLDVATMSLDFGSGFLDEEQVEVLRRLATVLGIDPIVVTPFNFACKYNGEHHWRTIVPFSAAPMRPTGDAPELLEALTTAKAGGDSAQLEAAKRALRASRAERRTEAATEPAAVWQPASNPLRPIDVCSLCHQTRPTPVVWQQGFDDGEYTLEVVDAPDDRVVPAADRSPLPGVLTMYHHTGDGEETVVDQRRVALDLDDQDDWIMWGSQVAG